MKREFMRLHLALGVRKIFVGDTLSGARQGALNPALDLSHPSTS
jgi:hypothetical protein